MSKVIIKRKPVKIGFFIGSLTGVFLIIFSFIFVESPIIKILLFPIWEAVGLVLKNIGNLFGLGQEPTVPNLLPLMPFWFLLTVLFYGIVGGVIGYVWERSKEKKGKK